MQPSYRWVIVAVGAGAPAGCDGAPGSFAVELGAVAIALVFPPLPRHQVQPA